MDAKNEEKILESYEEYLNEAESTADKWEEEIIEKADKKVKEKIKNLRESHLGDAAMSESFPEGVPRVDLNNVEESMLCYWDDLKKLIKE